MEATEAMYVSADGYVMRAFFQGPTKKVFRIAAMLGIKTFKTSQRNISLSITEHDRVTPEMLKAAETEWNKG